MTRKGTTEGLLSDDRNAARRAHPPRQMRFGVASTLLVLQAWFAAEAGADTLAVTRAENIREKMAQLQSGQPAAGEQEPTRLAQWPNWRNWGNWGNWPGWLPAKERHWRWPGT